MGLVNAVVPHAELDAEVTGWWAEIMRASPTALALAKRSFNADSESIRGLSAWACRRWRCLRHRGIQGGRPGVSGEARGEDPAQEEIGGAAGQEPGYDGGGQGRRRFRVFFFPVSTDRRARPYKGTRSAHAVAGPAARRADRMD